MDLAEKLGFDIKISLGFDPLRGYFPDCNQINECHCWNHVFILNLKDSDGKTNQINNYKKNKINFLIKTIKDLKKKARVKFFSLLR